MHTNERTLSEFLIHRGDALGYLYLVCNGSMEVLQDNMVVGILGKGDLVGYDVNTLGTDAPAALANGSKVLVGSHALVKSSSDLKALTYCDLKCIHIGGLLEVLKLYPEFSDTFHEEIIHDLSFNLREQHEEHDDEDDEHDEDEDDDLDEEDEDEEVDDEEGRDDEDADDGHDEDGDDVNGGHQEGGDNTGRRGRGAGGQSDADDQHDDSRLQGRPKSGTRPARPLQPPTPPSSARMGRLLRSIVAIEGGAASATVALQEPDRIGRYDHEEDEEMGAPSSVRPNGGSLGEDEDEDDEGEEEDDDDDDDDGPDEADNVPEDEEEEDEVEEEDGDDDRGQRADDNEQHDDSDDQSRRPDGDAGGSRAWLSGQADNAGSRADGRATNGARRPRPQQPARGRIAEGRGLDRRVSPSLEDLRAAANSGAGSLRRGVAYGGLAEKKSSSNEERVRRIDGRVAGKSLVNRRAITIEEHLSQSYEGLNSDKSFAPKSCLANANSDAGGSDELVLERHGAAGSGRLKPALGAQQSAGGSSASRDRPSKPPISFDLSRNTTAIVDRRRRSAGCIQRLNLVSGEPSQRTSAHQTQSQPSGGRSRCHSSLIHINENEPMSNESPTASLAAQSQRRYAQPASGQLRRVSSSATSGGAFGGGESARTGASRRRRCSVERLSSSQSQQMNAGADRGARAARVQSSYSNQDLKQIDAHITASVKKLRQEFKFELNNAIESLARLMLERQDQTGAGLGANWQQQRPRLRANAKHQPLSRTDRSLASAQSACSLDSNDSSSSLLRQRAINKNLDNSRRRQERPTCVSADVQNEATLTRSLSTIGLERPQTSKSTSGERPTNEAEPIKLIERHQAVVSLRQNWASLSSRGALTACTHLAGAQMSLDSAVPLVSALMSPSPTATSSTTANSRQLNQSPAQSRTEQQRTRQTGNAQLLGVNSDNDSGRSTSSMNSSGAAISSAASTIAKLILKTSDSSPAPDDSFAQSASPLNAGQQVTGSYTIDIKDVVSRDAER